MGRTPESGYCFSLSFPLSRMPHGFRAVLLALAVLALGAQPADAQNAQRRALDYINANASRHALSTVDASSVEVVSTAPGLRGKATHVYLTQRVNGLDVVPAKMTVSVMEDGRILSAMGRMQSGLALRAPSPAPSLSAEGAVRALATRAGLTPTGPLEVAVQKNGTELAFTGAGMSQYRIPARLVYTADDRGDLVLAWEVSIYQNDHQHDWHGYVDAVSGRIYDFGDRVVHENYATGDDSVAPLTEAAGSASGQASAFARPMLPSVGGASYRVFEYPVNSPYSSSPAYPQDGRTVAAGAEDAVASPFGWHDTDGVDGAEFTVTRGNNVYAYTDTNGDNNPDSGSAPDGGSALQFDFPLDFTQGPSAWRPAAVTNLFYWNNVVHDVFYQYGFDEASGNFQTNNYGRGGIDFDDAVYAEAQDAGNCNANFWTPNDDGSDDLNSGLGPRPRMQMYTCNLGNPDTDSDLDNDVIAHEYGHGISIRLTGGALANNCLRNSEQMGEGWSDWFGLVMNIDAGDVGTDPVPVGTYLLGQGLDGEGIRGQGYQPFPGAPYSTDFTVNEAHYGHTRTSGLSQPHGIGFVWATILWEMTWELIDEYGFDPNIHNADGGAGNQIALALVTEGMKIQPCSPGFVDGRDAILAADQALYGGEHIELLYRAFARRGLGLLADQGSSGSNGDNQESFVEPEENPPAAVSDLAATPDGDAVTLTFTATGDDGVNGTAASYDVRVSDAPITTDAEFEAATALNVQDTPLEAGQAEAIRVDGLDFETTYHFALKVADESFNLSPLSNTASTTTLAPPVATIPTATVNAFLAEGTTTATVRLRNDGPSTMTYGVSLAESDGTTARRLAAATAKSSTAVLPTSPTSGVKGDDGAPGETPRVGGGGPDGFGYRWVDSNEPGGPAYDWVDISGTGTALGFGDDDSETVALPAPFPFYGVDRDDVTIGSNGYLTFGGSGSTFSNTAIPDPDQPNGIIALFWDDLEPPSGGEVYYQAMSDGRFIVQYEEVDRYSNGTGAITAQAILMPGGAIVMQYEEVSGATTTSATVGIENDGGTDGLQIALNAPYLEDGLAIRIAALFVDAAPSAGFIPGGAGADVVLTFDATGLADGAYFADMTVTTNDPNTPTVVVPLVMTVGAGAVAGVSSRDIEQDVVAGQTEDVTLTISNPGSETLTWSLGGSVPTWLAIGTTSGSLDPGQSVDVMLTMDAAGYAAGDEETGSIQLTSNATAEPTVTIAVGMNVVAMVDAEDDADDEVYTLGQPYPNPSQGSARVDLRVAEAQTVLAELYDTLGRRVATLHDGPVAAGADVRLELRDGSLATGTYVLRVTGETFADARRLTISR